MKYLNMNDYNMDWIIDTTLARRWRIELVSASTANSLWSRINIERLHKAWLYASAVKVGHFEWLKMYIRVMDQKRAKPVSVKQETIP